MKRSLLMILLFSGLLLTSSCITYKNLLLFSEGGEFPAVPDSIINLSMPTIQPRDVLYITIQAPGTGEEAVRPYNLTQPLGSSTSGNSTLLGYLVDDNGYIYLPNFDPPIQAEGMTTDSLRTIITTYLSDFIVNPIVTVRFLNFRVNILGEVGTPGMINVTNERMTILEAISTAGGLTNYADNANVQLIREKNNTREYVTLNLMDKSIFYSPYFYLQQNDIIYIRPLQPKVAAVPGPTNRILPWVGVVASALNIYLIFTRL